MDGSLLDLALVVGIIGFAVSGYRQGFVVGALSFVGFFGGALFGVQLAPVIAFQFESQTSRVATALVIAFGCALIGQVLAVAIGSRVRASMRSSGLRVVDGFGGSVVSVIALLLVSWMVATPLASSSSPWLAGQVRRSVVIHAVNNAVPDAVRQLYERFGEVVEQGDFPQVLGPLTPTEVREVAPPDGELASSPVVTNAQASVVKVIGQAPSCDRRLEGTGFVYAENRVMTNAHVVAGTDEVEIEALGQEYEAKVVWYDPDVDVAVLEVKNLKAPVLKFNQRVASNADAIVVGYPEDGPYTATPARVRDEQVIKGDNIYKSREVRREVLMLRAEVRSGNSGGPLLATDGTVYGVVFAAAVDKPETGFALTVDQVTEAAVGGQRATEEVSTQECD
ncbi:MarP family serine protease [Cryptosporangium aurantiacum]|uniref:Colicin V production protein n=1 Tax=Cryptosporangium aurantiacum TaxID=134849 RepID=A0A1M7NID4_9ACTN|nr:MarP family serine protease [Cryptosporangium aurantiacum]SHN03552.1 Colicin V production protein [Cryptosporangium aurantiacum]